MLNVLARVHVDRVTEPIGRWLVGHGVAPDVVTVVGTVGTVAAALWFLPRGQLFVGALRDHAVRAVRPRRRGDGAGQGPTARRSARCSTRRATGWPTAPCSPR